MVTIEKIVITLNHQGKQIFEILENADIEEVKAYLDAVVEEE